MSASDPHEQRGLEPEAYVASSLAEAARTTSQIMSRAGGKPIRLHHARPGVTAVPHRVAVLLRAPRRVVDRVPAVGAPVYVGRDEARLVVCVRGESDRHVRLVQVTDAGRAVTDEEAYRRLAAGFLDPLTLEDTRLAWLLGRVVGAPETGAGGTA